MPYQTPYQYPAWANLNPPVEDPGAGLAGAGLWLGVFGGLTSMVGNFYATQSQKYALKSQASTLAFQRDISLINRRQSELEAQQILRAGEREMGRYSMQAAQEKAGAQVGIAARGIEAGVGSAAEQIASGDVIAKIDLLTIDSNRVRAAEQARMQAMNYQTQAMMQGVSARNVYESSRSLNPYTSASASLLSGAGSVASQWAESRRWQSYFDRQR